MLVARPAAAGDAADDIPEERALDDLIDALAAVKHEAEAAVHGLADADTAAVVERAEAHAARRVASEALHRHIRHDVAAVLDIRRLAEWRVRAGDIVVIASHHHGADLALAHELVELQRDADAPLRILIEDARLRADDEVVLLRVADPVVVVTILIAPIRINAAHRRLIRLDEIRALAGEADPAERAIAVVKELRPHDVLDIGRQDEAILVVDAILGKLLDTRIVNRLEEGIAVIKEIRAILDAGHDELILMAQALIDQRDELFAILGEHLRALLERQALRAVAALVGCVAGGLIAHEVDVDVVLDDVFEEIDDVAVVGDRRRRLRREMLLRRGKDLVEAVVALAAPALVEARLDARHIDLSDDTDRMRDLRRLRLRAAHTAHARAHEKMSREIAVLRYAEMHAARVQERIVRAVHDALRADVHPAASRHLPIVRDAHLLRDLPVLRIVELTDHERIRDDDARRRRLRREQAERIAALHHERLMIRHDLKILLDETVLEPVVADAARLAVRDELVGIKTDLEVEVVVDHDLESLALCAIPLVFIDGLAVDPARGTIAIRINTPVRLELLEELRNELFMKARIDIAKCVLERRLRLRLREMKPTGGRAANPRHELRHIRILLDWRYAKRLLIHDHPSPVHTSSKCCIVARIFSRS